MWFRYSLVDSRWKGWTVWHRVHCRSWTWWMLCEHWNRSDNNWRLLLAWHLYLVRFRWMRQWFCLTNTSGCFQRNWVWDLRFRSWLQVGYIEDHHVFWNSHRDSVSKIDQPTVLCWQVDCIEILIWMDDDVAELNCAFCLDFVGGHDKWASDSAKLQILFTKSLLISESWSFPWTSSSLRMWFCFSKVNPFNTVLQAISYRCFMDVTFSVGNIDVLV